MNKTTIWIVIAIVIIGGFVVLKSSGNENESGSVAVANGDVKEFRVKAFQFGFDPGTIEVNQGDKVIITAYSVDVPHGLSIPGYSVNLYLDGLREQTVEFIADKKGTFSFGCSVPCGVGHSSMGGQLVVN